MSYLAAWQVHTGDTVHVGPHDICFRDPYTGCPTVDPPYHTATADADITLTGTAENGTVVSLYWDRGATVYDRDDVLWELP